jgi:hypothetical protein
MLTACGEDDPVSTPRRHYVVGPEISGPTRVPFDGSGCWTVTSEGLLCTYGHETMVWISIDNRTDYGTGLRTVCLDLMRGDWTVHARATCLEDQDIEGTSELRVHQGN